MQPLLLGGDWTGLAPGLVYVLALLLALLLDVALGEPPARWHPVVWLGNYLSWAGRRCAPRVSSAGGDMGAALPVARYPKLEFWRGMGHWLAGAALVVLIAWALQATLLAGPGWLAALGLGVLLKPLLAWRMLYQEVQAVELALGQSLAAGRERLSWLCSRDVSMLSEAEVRETAIESLAENFNDSVVAPVFWFVLLGLPGAALYRYANTADAMWGYVGQRKGRDWTWAGKWAARVDDVLSWLPARISAALLALAAGGVSFAALRREAAVTPSPNGGWPMAAMALALDVGLGKPGVYRIHSTGGSPQHGHTRQALRLASRSVPCLLVLACGVLLFTR